MNHHQSTVSPEPGRRAERKSAAVSPSACVAENGSLPVRGERFGRLSRSRRIAHRLRCGGALPLGTARAARRLPRGRGRRHLDGRRARRAPDRELPRRAGRGDARSALRTRALDRRRDRAADPPLPGRRRSRSRSRTSASCARTRRRSTSAATCSRRMPDATRIPVPTTAEAAQPGGRGRRCRRMWRSSSPEAVVLYGLTLLADDIGDHTALHSLRLDRPLHRARRPARHGADGVLVRDAATSQARSMRRSSRSRASASISQRLVSRPQPATPWKYRFDAVVAGHPLEPTVRQALREVKAVTRELRVVGVYEGHEEEG